MRWFTVILVCAIPTAQSDLLAAPISDEQIHIRFYIDEYSPSEITVHFDFIPTPYSDETPNLTLPSEAKLVREGFPDLPAITRFIAIPPLGDPQVTTIQERVVEPGRNINIQASPPNENAPDEFWPPSSVKVGKPVIMRGIRIAPVTVYPYRIDTGTGRTEVIRECAIQLRFEPGTGTNPVMRQLRPVGRGFGRLIEAMLINPPHPNRDYDYPFGGSYLYLIPEAEGVEEALAPLVEWRRRSGCQVVVQTVAGDRDAARQAIQNAYDQWQIPPEYVVIVADADGENVIDAWQDEVEPVTDHGYTLLDGDDFLPDVALGRISWENLEELQRVVAKIVQYESQPTMDNRDWYNRGVVCTYTRDPNSSMILVCRWIYDRMLEDGYEQADTSYTRRGRNFRDWFENRIEDGVSLIITRSMNDWNNNRVPGLENAPQWPLLIMAATNTNRFWREQNEDDAEYFFRAIGGAVGAIGGSYENVGTHYGNLFAGGMIQGLIVERILEFGWALNRAKYELYRQYNGLTDDPFNDESEWWEAHVRMFNLIGDPGTRLWAGAPGEMAVEVADQVIRGANRLEVTVTRQVDGTPLAEALACLYHPEGVFITGLTDDEGRYVFVMPNDEMAVEGAHLTVTYEEFAPFLGEVEFLDAGLSFGVGEVTVNDQDGGDGDGRPDWAETAVVTFALTNYGEQVPEGQLTVSVSSLSPFLETEGEPVVIENSPQPGEAVDVTIQVEISPQCPNGEELTCNVDVQDAQEQLYRSSFTLIGGAPLIEIAQVQSPEGELMPGQTVPMNIELINQGDDPSAAYQAQLLSHHQMVTVVQAECEFNAIEPESRSFQAGEAFRLQAHEMAIPGMVIPMELRIQNERSDTLRFEIRLAPPEATDPFGPDDYGYVCFDNSDEDRRMAPQFEWIEIDTSLNGDGEALGFRRIGNNSQSVVVEMPFSFMFYGQEFDRITVCQNGWIAPGEQTKFVDFRNRCLPTPLGPNGKVCVFWDYLTGNEESGIYGKHLEDEGVYVIEWSRMRHVIAQELGDIETFEILIFDPEIHPVNTGDCQLQFQYLEITDSPEGYDWDTPYATVGIQGFEQDHYLQYCYWNQYANGAAPLQNGRAILFTTDLYMIIGELAGRVTDLATDEPMQDVNVQLNVGLEATTDVNGEFLFEELRARRGVTVTVEHPGYNSWLSEEIEITDERIHLDIALRHPEFALSEDSLDFEMDFGEQLHHDLTIRNDGNGPLQFSAILAVLPQEPVRDDPWDRLLEINATDSTGDSRINGVAWTGSSFWVAGANNDQEPNLFHRFDRDGIYIDSIPQPYDDDWGARGMAYNKDLVWLYGDAGVMAVNWRCRVVRRFDGPHENGRGIAVDPETDEIYLSGVLCDNSDEIYRMDGDGNLQGTIPTRHEIYGLSWHPADPDNCPLYLTVPADVGGQVRLVKMNPEVGQEIEVTLISREQGDRAAGSEITGMWRLSCWTLVTIIQNPRGDRLEVHELGPRETWISIDTTSGIVEPGVQMIIGLDIDTEGSEGGDHGAEIVFTHTAAGGSFNLPIYLHLPDTVSVTGIILPEEFEVGECYPNPFNATTRIEYNLPGSRYMKAYVYDLRGNMIQEIVNTGVQAGRGQLIIDADSFASGVYLLKLTTEDHIIFRKMVVLK